MKEEEEVMKVDRQIEECLCSNVCDVCSNDLSREESETFWENTFNKWNSQIREERKQIREERKNVIDANNKCVAELKHIKIHGHKMRKK